MTTTFEPGVQKAYDLLATMVAVVRADARCAMVNAALENALCQSRRKLVGASALDWFADPEPLKDALRRLASQQASSSRFEATLKCQPPGTRELAVRVVASPLTPAPAGAPVLIEMMAVERQLRLDREQRMHALVQSHRELLRNLAHEVRNPLGGIRGAAQLLAMEAASSNLHEYTDVIIREVDRLQALVNRLLAPHQRPLTSAPVNVHEVCERVRALVLAEFATGLAIERDYDTSLPLLRGDGERLIQAVLNITRNAAQALEARRARGDARIVLRTRIARQITLGGQRHRLALELQIADNGPGVPEALRERLFQPLVTGHDGGSGLGLTLAQAFVQQHGGAIEYDSEPGATRFTLLLPLPTKTEASEHT